MAHRNSQCIFAIVFLILSANLTQSQVICDTATCTFIGPNYKNQVLECTQNVDTCTITKCTNRNDCQGTTLYSAAKSTSIKCDNGESCKNLVVECNGQNIDKCEFKCINGDSCRNIQHRCYGDIASCTLYGQVSNSITGSSSSMTCDVTESDNQCSLSLDNSGWSTSITLNCLSGLDNCECQNSQFANNCNTATIVTAEPTTSPTTSNPTLAPSTNPTGSSTKRPTFTPTKLPTQSPFESGSAADTKEPTKSPIVIIEEIKVDNDNKSNCMYGYVRYLYVYSHDDFMYIHSDGFICDYCHFMCSFVWFWNVVLCQTWLQEKWRKTHGCANVAKLYCSFTE